MLANNDDAHFRYEYPLYKHLLIHAINIHYKVEMYQLFPNIPIFDVYKMSKLMQGQFFLTLSPATSIRCQALGPIFHHKVPTHEQMFTV